MKPRFFSWLSQAAISSGAPSLAESVVAAVTHQQHLIYVKVHAYEQAEAAFSEVVQQFKDAMVIAVKAPTPGSLLRDILDALRIASADNDAIGARRQLALRLDIARQQKRPIVCIVNAAHSLYANDVTALFHFFPPGHASIVAIGEGDLALWKLDQQRRQDAAAAPDIHDLAGAQSRRRDTMHSVKPSSVGLDHTTVPAHQVAPPAPAPRARPAWAKATSALLDHEPKPGAATVQERIATHHGLYAQPQSVPDKRLRPEVETSDEGYGRRVRTRELESAVARWRRLTWAAALLLLVALTVMLFRPTWAAQVRAGLATFAIALSDRLAGPPTPPVVARTPAPSTAPAEQLGRPASDEMARDASPAQPPPPPSPAEMPAPATASAPQAPTPLASQARAADPADPSDQAVADMDKQPAVSAPGVPPATASPSPAPQATPPPTTPDHASVAAPTGDVRWPSPGLPAAPVLSPESVADICRMYAERATYEIEKGQADAAAITIARGLAVDPHNARLLTLETLVRGAYGHGVP